MFDGLSVGKKRGNQGNRGASSKEGDEKIVGVKNGKINSRLGGMTALETIMTKRGMHENTEGQK